MVRLRRSGVKKPKDWDAKVAKALKNLAAFLKAARAFEKLAEHGPVRAKGFIAYSGHVLPASGKKSKKKREFPAVWQRHPVLKRDIIEMSGGYCAYCQTPVTANHPGKRPGQVEHLKPKSRFPTWAYRVLNYLLACMGCNVAKGDKWPRGGYVWPDRGEPEKRFVFAKDGTVKARVRDVAARNTIDDLDLNRSGLVELRRVMIEAQLKHVPVYMRAQKVGARAKLPLVETFFPVSEAINQNVRRAWVRRRRKRR